MTFEGLTGRRIGVWGAGAEGTAAVRRLDGAAESTTFILDDPSPSVVDALRGEFGCDVVSPADALDRPFDLVIRSAGVPTRRPEMQAFERRGIPVRGLVALWLSAHRHAPVIAITGTKGKSTTAALCAALLHGGGATAALGGNIGIPVIELPDDADAYVIEVSSHQAADVADSPRVGVLTSLDVDHLPWHGGVEHYWRDKVNLFAHDGLEHFVAPTALLGHQALASSPAPSKASDDDVVVTGAEISVAGRPGRPLGGLFAARHNAENLALAVRAVRALGIDVADTVVDRVIAEYAGLPSRLHTIAEVDGVRYVDDALASNPLACAAGVEAMGERPFVLVAGGADRGVEVAELGRVLGACESLRGVVLFSETAEQWSAELVRAGVAVERLVVVPSDDVVDAVHAAAPFLAPGTTVLFSPAAPTPAALGTYLERSAAFARAVDRSGR